MTSLQRVYAALDQVRLEVNTFCDGRGLTPKDFGVPNVNGRNPRWEEIPASELLKISAFLEKVLGRPLDDPLDEEIGKQS